MARYPWNSALLVIAVALPVASAKAQTHVPAASPPPAAEPAAAEPGIEHAAEPAAVAPAPAAEPAADPVGEAYHDAFRQLAAGDALEARTSLRGLVDTAPDHPLAGRARRVLDALDAAASAEAGSPRAVPQPPSAEAQSEVDETGAMTLPGQPGDADLVGGARTTASARAELVFFQTVHGLVLGAELCGIAQCGGARPWVLTLMLGSGLGFGASFYASEDGITPAFARALTDGVLIGAAEGVGLLMTTEAASRSDHEVEIVMAHLMGGQLVGLGLGALLYDTLRPRTGQVSLTFSGGIWAWASMFQLVGALDLDPSEQEWGALLLATGNLGLLAGGLLASEVPMGASRVLMIDAGGLLGALTGMGLAVLVQSEAQQGPTLGAGLAGTLLGLGTAYVLTEGWDRQDDADAGLRLGVTPVPGGAMVGLSGVL